MPGDIEYLKAGQVVNDRFTYRISDGQAGADRAVDGLITVVITGSNDAPAALTRTGALQLTEAGGTDNGTQAASTVATVNGSFTFSDTDTDDTPTWRGGAGMMVDTAVTVTAEGSDFTGTYGTFNLKDSGEYTYTLNQADPDTEALDGGDTGATDTFTVLANDGTTDSRPHHFQLPGGRRQ